jgi:hypothetical protein
MPIKNTFARSFKRTKHPKTITGRIASKAISLTGRIKDPTGIAGSWSDSRPAEEIIANIHDSRKSKR